MGPSRDLVLRRSAWHVPGTLDVAPMRRALAHLAGRHAFGAFCAAPGRQKDPVCRVRAVHVVRRRSRVALLLSADRFLHHMARTIVGSAVAVGRGARDPEWLAKVLASRGPPLAGAPAPRPRLRRVRRTSPRSNRRGDSACAHTRRGPPVPPPRATARWLAST